MSNHAFEYTPNGIVPLGAYRETQEDGAMAGATLAPAHIADLPSRPAGNVTKPAPTSPVTRASPLKPVDVVKLARARLRELERDIKRLRKLEVERDELKRLLEAAAHQPRATIRSLPTRSA